jgi:hypothetical protein
MRHADGAHTHSRSGSGLAETALMAAAAVFVAAVAAPIIQAITGLLVVLAVITGALVVLGSAGLVVFLRARRRHSDGTAVAFHPQAPWRAGQALPAPRPQAIKRPQELHLHLHGTSAEDLAAILSRVSHEDR